MITVQTNTMSMQRSIGELAKELSARTGKSVEHVTRQQAGILVGQVIAVTPPGTRQGATETGGITLAAKKAGEAAIASDIAKLFPTTAMNEERAAGLVSSGHFWKTKAGRVRATQTAWTEDDLERLHQAARNPRTGRVRRGNQWVGVTRRAVLRAFLKRKLAQVGELNAGWLPAARELKTSSRAVPAWIRRHGDQPGGVDVKVSAEGVNVRIFNDQSYFPGGMVWRLDYALKRRQRGMEKALQDLADRAAKRAQRRMGR